MVARDLQASSRRDGGGEGGLDAAVAGGGGQEYDPHVGLLAYLIILFFVGLLVGALARLLVPGPDPMGVGLTAVIGLTGTFIGGLFSWYVLGWHGPGIILSVLVSALLVWGFRSLRDAGGSRRTMGGGPRRR
jgi:uncharacterized membrane protein YeaQ/YmgE (transglycosylase-associated protein family)